MQKIAIYWFTLLLLFTFGTSTAEAHANLLATTPDNMEVVSTTPEQVVLDFSEPLEAGLFDLQLYDWNAREIDLPPPALAKGNASQMVATLPTLPNGTYTVVWGVVSEDGHPVKGSFSFSVGTMTQHHTYVNVDSTDLPNPWLVGLRYVAESLLLIGGGLFFFTRMGSRYQLPEDDQLISKRTRKILWVTLVVLSVAQWFVYSNTLPGSGLTNILLQGNGSLLLQNPFAMMVSLQLLLLLLLALPNMQTAWYGLVWTLLVGNLAFGGHAWGIEPVWLSLTVRVLHLWSLALWLGGLAYLALTFVYAKRNQLALDRSRFRNFFTRSAMLSTLLLGLSGVLMVTLQTDWKFLLQGYIWSNLLLVKVAMMAIMLGFAAVQTMRWRRTDSKLSAAGLRVELLIGVLAVLVAVLISQMSYPVPIKPYAQTLQAINSTEQATVQIPALTIGTQVMTLGLPQHQGADPVKVTVQIDMTGMDMGEQEVTHVHSTQGEYQAKLNFSMSGKWHFVIEASYPDNVKLQWADTVILPKGGTP